MTSPSCSTLSVAFGSARRRIALIRATSSRGENGLRDVVVRSDLAIPGFRSASVAGAPETMNFVEGESGST